MDALDGEEGACCRICRLPASHNSALFSPCKCSGSIKYVHQDCLLSWLNHSGHRHCELCRHRFKFRPVYAPDAPSRLPWTELVCGLARKGATGLVLGARVLMVATTWLFVVPLLTCWMWRLAFLTSVSQGLLELSRRFQPVLVIADCVQGTIIATALILLVLLGTYTADQIKAYWQIMQPQQPEHPVALNADQPYAEAFEDGRGGFRFGGEDRRQASGQDEPGRYASGSADMGTREWGERQAETHEAGPSQSGRNEGHGEPGGAGPSGSSEDHGMPEPIVGRRIVRVVRGGERQQGDLQQRRGPARPRQVPFEDADPGARGRGRPPPPENHDPQGDREQVGFNELIGLEGPFHVLLENAGTVIFTIWAFMTAALWMPFMLGRLVVPVMVAWKDLLSTLGAWRVAEPVLSFLLRPAAPSNATGPVVGSTMGNQTESEAWDGLASKIAVLPLAQRIAEELEAHLSGPALNDWVSLGIGYSVLFLVAMLALWTVVVWKLLFSRELRQGLRGQTDILRAAFADLGHQTRLHVGYAAVMIKVSVVLMLELTLLPALHGCWVDFCLLPLFGSRWAERMLWLQASPISFLLVHWTLGMGFLMGVATFLSVLRQQLRQGALPFFRDPYEGDEEPMRALMMLGLSQQLEREAYAMSCLFCLTVLLLHIPLRLTKLALPGTLPLRFSLSSPFAEAPTDLLLFHFLLPITLPRLRVRHFLVRGLRQWLTSVSKLLGLDDYLLPGQPGDNNQPPVVIPHGIPGQEEDEQSRQAWRVEVDGARQRSGRLVVLLALMVATLVTLNTALLNLPILTGRLVFWALHLPSQHDMYNAFAGAYTLWLLLLAGKQVMTVRGSRSVEAAAQLIGKWAEFLLRIGTLACLGLGVLPLLIGLFLELALFPIRLRSGETPSCFLYQDWAVGLLFLRLFARTVLGWPRLENANRRREHERAGLEAWFRQPLRRLRTSLRRLKRDGLANLKFTDAFANVLWPMLSFWGAAVCIPYVLCRGLAPRLPLVTEGLLHAAFTYAWASELVLFLLLVCTFKVASALERLGKKLRDQRYLLHRELINMSD